jgi:hypothetical protein
MRRLVGLVLVLLLVLGAIADRVSVVELILRLPSWVQFAVGWLIPPENWLIEQQIHPLPLALAVLVFFLLVLTPGDLHRFLPWRRTVAPNIAWRSAADRVPRDAADEFRWGLERCYRRYAEASQIVCDQAGLVRLIDGLRFPPDFPGADADPATAKAAFSPWPTPEGSQLWAFAQDLFETMLHAQSGDYRGVDTAPFLKAQRRAARFWDECGRARAARRAAARFRGDLAAYARDVKILALIERARSEFLPWSDTDRSGLFRLAMEI